MIPLLLAQHQRPKMGHGVLWEGAYFGTLPAEIGFSIFDIAPCGLSLAFWACDALRSQPYYLYLLYSHPYHNVMNLHHSTTVTLLLAIYRSASP
jgi:hypothetical protein